SKDATARIWDIKTRRISATLTGHTSTVVSAAFSLDGRQVLTASSDNTARVWDRAIRPIVTTLSGHRTPDISPDGLRFITASSDSTAKVLSMDTGTELVTLRGHTGRVNFVAFSPDGVSALSGSKDGTARLWNTETGMQLLLFAVAGEVDAGRFSPDGKRVVTLADKRLQLWDATTGVQIASYESDTLPTFLPDGRGILLTENLRGLIFDAKTGASLTVFDFQDRIDPLGHNSDRRRFRTVTVAPDGTYFSINKAMLWDAKRNAEVRFQGVYLVLSTDGPRIISFVRQVRRSDHRFVGPKVGRIVQALETDGHRI